MTEAAFLGFLLVFVRCSAMFLTCPVFGAQNTPLPVRIFTTLAVSGALAFAIQPAFGGVPEGLFGLVSLVVREALAGILLGTFVSLSMQALGIAGAIMDLQTGLASSHVVNPLNGVQTTVLSQFKTMLAVVVFLAADAHHLLIQGFVRSYHVVPSFGLIEQSFAALLARMFIIALEIAAPVMAVGFLVDAALALLGRAVPQMQVMQVGLPAKIGAGLGAVALVLPITVAGVHAAVLASFDALRPLFHW